MKQINIDFTNYKRFEKLHLDFHERFTLLVGVNGTGKTSTLKGIKQSWSLIAVGANSPRHSFDFADVHQSRSTDESNEVWMLSKYPASLMGDIDFFEEQHSVGLKLDAVHREKLICESSVGLAVAVKGWFAENEKGKAIPLLAFYSAIKPSGSDVAGAISRPFEQRHQTWRIAGDGHLNVQQLTAWFQYYELRGLQEKTEPMTLRVMREAVKQAIHAQDVKFVVRENALMVRYEDSGWRKFNDLSDGQQRISAIFMDLAMRCASLNSHLGEKSILETSGIVLIDELDLHLHPQWQHALIDDLLKTFPKLQFIATSHSPFLYQAAFANGWVVDLATQQRVIPSDPSLEDIAEEVMKVHMPQRSKRWQDMKAAALQYYQLLEVAKKAPSDQDVQAVKERLDELIIPYTDDPAYAAWLEMHRTAAGL
jgi:hypothetical protein